MFLFLRLLAGHFIGDFFLQTKEVYEAKKKSFLGVVLHGSLVFAAFLALSFPYLNVPACWAVIIFASVVHIALDHMKLKLTARKWQCVFFVLDQMLHVLSVSPILLFQFAYVIPREDSLIMRIYANDALFILGIGFTLSVLAGKYLKQTWKLSVFGAVDSDYDGLGMSERFIVTAGVIYPYILLALAVCVYLRWKKRKGTFNEVVFNYAYAAIIGLVLRKLI